MQAAEGVKRLAAGVKPTKCYVNVCYIFKNQIDAFIIPCGE